MIAVAGSNDPVSVSIHRLSGRFLNRCGQKPCRFFWCVVFAFQTATNILAIS